MPNQNYSQPFVTEFNTALSPQVSSLPTSGSGQSQNDRRFYTSTNQLVYWETGFSGPSADWYLVGSQNVTDSFTRADSASSLSKTDNGRYWLPSAGTFGISSNKAYNPSATNNDQTFFWLPELNDGTIQYKATPSVSGANYNTPCLLFRRQDTDNLLRVTLTDSLIRLDKRDAATPATLASTAQTFTNNTEYTICIVMAGINIKIYVNGTQKINYDLVSTEYKYLGPSYSGIGLVAVISGAVTNVTRWDDLRVRQKAQ